MIFATFLHFQCVPTIFWTTLVLSNKLFPWHTTMPLLLGPLKLDVILNVSFLTALGYALYFIGLEVSWALHSYYIPKCNS